MRFEWDPDKERKNIKKHGIDFTTAALVFEDPLAVPIQNQIVQGEERWVLIGMARTSLLLVVAHAYKDIDETEIVEIINAREAEPHERRVYEHG